VCGVLQVYILPTIRINNGQYRGKLSYTEVLRAICAGFTKNAEPKVCLRVSVDDSCRDGSIGQTTCALRSASAPFTVTVLSMGAPWIVAGVQKKSQALSVPLTGPYHEVSALPVTAHQQRSDSVSALVTESEMAAMQ